MIKREKLIISGKSGSGKDFLLRELKKIGLNPSVKITTRPKREFEIDGVNYHFKTQDEFKKIIESNGLIVNQEFLNDKGDIWNYGISIDDFSNNQVFIMTPGEISQINSEDRKNCFVVYLDIDRSVRESRLLTRNDLNDSVKRRLDSDELDFSKFTDYDLRITYPYFDTDLIFDLMV